MERRVCIALCVFLACCPCASALNPSLDVNQYAHNAWGPREGFFKGTIQAIAQTPDGYLWLGTEFGLLRFDAVRTVPWQPPAGAQLPSGHIRSLLAARDGRLWIGTQEGLASWRDGKLTHYPELAGQIVLTLLEDGEGTVWSGTFASAGRLCAIRSGSTHCYGEDGSFGRGVLSLYEDNRGNLWAGAENGLWRCKPGPPKLYLTPGPVPALIQGENGALLIAMAGGLRQLVDGKVEAYPLPAGRQFSRPNRLMRDRDGGLWIGNRGLLHVHQGRTDLFARGDGLSGDRVMALLEDREGNIWVSTVNGLDRFTDFAVPTISVKHGLSNSAVWSILAARDGSVWLGTPDGLNRWNDGQITTYRTRSGLSDGVPESLFEDDRGRIWVSTSGGVAYVENGRFIPVRGAPGGGVHSIAGDSSGNLWISYQDHGLFHLHAGTVLERIPWTSLGRKDFAWTLFPDPIQGGLWLGFWQGGVAYFKGGRIRASYASAEGLVDGMVRDFSIDGNGALWVATDGGLSRIKDDRVLTLTSQNGLPCNSVHWMMEDDSHSVWLYQACGLVRIARSELDAWAADSKRTIHATVLDSSDGVTIHSEVTSGYTPRVAKSADGRLWFLSGEDVSVIDPHHLPFNKLPPPVHIERVVVDDKPYDLGPRMRLPPNVRNLRIEYTALSLVAPGKIHFKYKLEGQNQNWHEVINERQATYTNLGPRNYRFRVIASNNSGVWNETGDTLEFSIAPAYYQTNWFRALLAATALALMWAGYQLRVRLLQRESRQLRDVIDTIPASAWSAGPDGSVEFFNERWLEYTGPSTGNGLGWGWETAIHPEDRDRFVAEWRAAIASGKPMEAEARVRRTDGQYRWLLIRNVPLRDKAGRVVKWYGTSTDIEELKRAEQEREKLHQLESELAHINRVSMMGELAASVAHEVNQPLTGIVSNGSASLRFLAGDAPNLEEAREAIRDIVRDGKRAGEVIARIRALTKRTALPKEKLDLNEIIREVLALVGDQARKNGVMIRTQFADDLSPVFGDRVQLQQVLLNLVMNGIEAMSGMAEGARRMMITTQNVHGDQVQVTVEDSGAGLDPNTKARMFEAFFTTKAGGMGMGLSICRSILQNHGGRLWATANEGPGASFHFALPKYKGEEGNAGLAGD